MRRTWKSLADVNSNSVGETVIAHIGPHSLLNPEKLISRLNRPYWVRALSGAETALASCLAFI